MSRFTFIPADLVYEPLGRSGGSIPPSVILAVICVAAVTVLALVSMIRSRKKKEAPEAAEQKPEEAEQKVEEAEQKVEEAEQKPEEAEQKVDETEQKPEETETVPEETEQKPEETEQKS